MMRKKGAIEMSMQTIIIVIIGVTLLALGIKFVVDTMGDVGGMSQSVMSKGDTMIDELFGDSDETLSIMPEELEVERGDSGKSTIYIRNTGYDLAKFTLDVSVDVAPEISGDGGTKAIKAAEKWISYSVKEISLNEGEVAPRILLVNPPKTAKLGVYMMMVTVKSAEIEESKEIIITIGSG